MTQREGKFTRGPCVLNFHHGGPCTGVEAELAEMEDSEPFNLSQALFPEMDIAITWDSRTEGATAKAEANAHLIAAAVNAATAAEGLGYDGHAVVEALPELLMALWRIAYEPQGHPEASESEVLTRCEDIAGEVLTALRTKEPVS